MTAHKVTIRPPRRANDPLDYLAQCTCGKYRRGWRTDVHQWRDTHTTHSLKVEGEG